MLNALVGFLEAPGRPPGTLRYHELQGFLFAIVTAPETVMPSEWIPEVFGGREAGFETVEEAQAILPELMALYNAVNTPVVGGRATLPPDCKFRRKTMANLDDTAPISQWSRGFLAGYQWLQDDWDACVPDEYDRDFGAMLLILSFFASPTLADAYTKELGHTDVEAMAARMRQAFPEALAAFAHIGRSVHETLLEHNATLEPAQAPKVGRNDPCPCGSGRKYKKCCGAAPAH
jgi:uncharacterized protein